MTDNVLTFSSKSKEPKDIATEETILITFNDESLVVYKGPEYGISIEMPSFLIVRPKDVTNNAAIMYNLSTIKSIHSTVS